MLRAYKYRLYPNKSQIDFFEKQFGTCRFIYNWALDLKSTAYKDENRSVSKNELKNMLSGLKAQYDWLKDVNSQSLQGSIDNLDNALRSSSGRKQSILRSSQRIILSNRSRSHSILLLTLTTVRLNCPR